MLVEVLRILRSDVFSGSQRLQVFGGERLFAHFRFVSNVGKPGGPFCFPEQLAPKKGTPKNDSPILAQGSFLTQPSVVSASWSVIRQLTLWMDYHFEAKVETMLFVGIYGQFELFISGFLRWWISSIRGLRLCKGNPSTFLHKSEAWPFCLKIAVLSFSANCDPCSAHGSSFALR